MKRLLFFVCVIVFCVPLAACADGSYFEQYNSSISELRRYVFSFSDDEMSINIYSGEREKNFIVDGRAGERVEFCVINIVPASGVSPSASYTYVLNCAGKEYSGSFERHPFNENYSAEASASCGSEISITISGSGYNRTFSLQSVLTGGMIGYKRAFDIACKRLKPQIETMKNKNGLNAEIFIRLIDNPINNNGGYYWYVAFVDQNQTTYAALVDPSSEKIVAVRD